MELSAVCGVCTDGNLCEQVSGLTHWLVSMGAWACGSRGVSWPCLSPRLVLVATQALAHPRMLCYTRVGVVPDATP